MKRRAAATAAGTIGALVLMASPAAADVDVTNTETVQVYLNEKGEVDVARVYDQLDLTGTGSVQLRNPVTADGLRNLDGFRGYSVEDGDAVIELDVDGDQRLRTVSPYRDQPPLSVAVEYRLDGEEVEAGDIVGESGELEVIYQVKNETGEMQEISFDDGTGSRATTQEEVFVPIVGSMTTVLPSTFTDVRSDQANAAGDGRGGTKLSFTLTLFPPIGAPEQEFGYTAQITDGIIPAATLSALPVSPLDSPTFATAAEAYSGGAESGIELAEGAGTIDENLLKLRDGAADLLAGLIQLRDGAEELSTGLVDRAAPGARELADGLGNQLAPGAEQLADGGQELADGLEDQLAPGAEQLADGGQELANGLTKRLVPGVKQLAAGGSDLANGAGRLADGLASAGQQAPALITGLQQVSAGLDLVDKGLTTLYNGIGTVPAQAQPLHDGIAQLKAGIGDLTTSGTLLNGVDQIRLGLEGTFVPALSQMAAGVFTEADNRDDLGAYQKLGCAVTVLTAVKDEVNSGYDSLCFGGDAAAAALAGLRLTTPTEIDAVTANIVLPQLIDALEAGQQELANPANPFDQTTLYGGLNGLKAAIGAPDQTGTILAGLVRIECGISNASLPGVCPEAQPGLLQGLNALDAGVTQLVDGVVARVQGGIGEPGDAPTVEPPTLRGGINGLSDGVDQIALGGQALINGLALLGGGANQLEAGSLRLSAGAGQLADGAEDAASGAGQIAKGAGQLADGAQEAADGAGQIADGAEQVADGADTAAAGADTLADGLDDAAAGSDLLFEGLQQAAEGAPQLVDGAQQLSTEGASQIEVAGQETAADFGTRYALMEAGAERAKNEPLVNGAPEDAVLLTAFSYELPEVSGAGGQNATRGLLALAVFAAAAGAGALVAKRRHAA